MKKISMIGMSVFAVALLTGCGSMPVADAEAIVSTANTETAVASWLPADTAWYTESTAKATTTATAFSTTATETTASVFEAAITTVTTVETVSTTEDFTEVTSATETSVTETSVTTTETVSSETSAMQTEARKDTPESRITVKTTAETSGMASSSATEETSTSSAETSVQGRDYTANADLTESVTDENFAEEVSEENKDNLTYVKQFSRGTYYAYGCPKKGGSGRALIECNTSEDINGSIASSYLYRNYGYNYQGDRTMVYLEISGYPDMNGYYYLDDSDAGNSNVIDFYYVNSSNCPFKRQGVVTVDCWIVG